MYLLYLVGIHGIKPLAVSLRLLLGERTIPQAHASHTERLELGIVPSNLQALQPCAGTQFVVVKLEGCETEIDVMKMTAELLLVKPHGGTVHAHHKLKLPVAVCLFAAMGSLSVVFKFHIQPILASQNGQV